MSVIVSMNKPMVIAVCADCEADTREAVDVAFMAGIRHVITQAKMDNKYWAKELEAMMFGPPDE